MSYDEKAEDWIRPQIEDGLRDSSHGFVQNKENNKIITGAN